MGGASWYNVLAQEGFVEDRQILDAAWLLMKWLLRSYYQGKVGWLSKLTFRNPCDHFDWDCVNEPFLAKVSGFKFLCT